jgi:hypothetical protein
VNQCQTSTTRQQVSTPVLGFFADHCILTKPTQSEPFLPGGVANEAGNEKQWTCFWGIFVLVLHLQETNLRERKF